MTSFILTPTPQPIFNHFDRFGLLLGLPRLEGERNPEYKQRLFDVFVNRSNSTYRGLINGITRELGLQLNQPLRITRISGTNPVIVFLNTKCLVFSDYASANPVAEFDRFDYSAGAFTVQQLATKINSTGIFSCQVDPTYANKRSMTILNQSNLSLVSSEDISRAGGRIKLENSNIIPNSIAIRSSNLLERVSNVALMRKAGQYYIDPALGIIDTLQGPAPGSSIRYQYISNTYKVIASPVIIHDLQSDDFKSKMFEQVSSEEDDTLVDGLPTELGADLINELLSVYPTAFGV